MKAETIEGSTSRDPPKQGPNLEAAGSNVNIALILILCMAMLPHPLGGVYNGI